jgi:hypothetical protein
MKKTTLLSAFIILAFSSYCYSQDTIALINGRQIAAVSVPDSESTNIYYNIARKDGSLKMKKVDLLDVFSIKYSNKLAKLIYKQDSIFGYELSNEDMNHFILGEQHAIKYYKSPLAFPAGFIAAPVLVNYMGFYSFISPAVVATGIGLKTPKLKHPELVSEALRSDKNFIEGYRIQATKTKVRNAIFGGITGIAVSLVMLAAFSK